MKRGLKRFALAFLGVLPIPVGLLRMGVRLLLVAMAGKRPTKAMKALLLVEDDLSTFINWVAVHYDEGLHVKHRLTRYHDFFTKRVQRGERVLDIGSGNGALAYDLATVSGAEVTGIDISEETVELARRKYNHQSLRFVHGDVLNDMPKERFDVVVMSNVLEHLEERILFMHSIDKMLSPRKILIRVPMIDSDWRIPLRKELGLFYFSDNTHHTEYTKDSFESEMAEAGFVISHIQINWGEIWAEVRPK